ncbi:hypothetical protein GALL_494020 [mine drainage metagenome]|uniref:Uncharacterized protein n=1 Tax=mine drainage metagenome TaxID=410659 RepID=A0A1J5PCE7_9ZZZZ
MGEARRRGTYEERVRQAVARQNAGKLNKIGVPMPIARHITEAPASQPAPSPRRPVRARGSLLGAAILGLLSSQFGLGRRRPT